MNQIELSECKEWLSSVGKRKIQSFQDCFAELFNISMDIMSVDGKPIIVRSNSSLFCNCIIKNNSERCENEKINIIDYVLKKRKTIKYTCYMGVTYFACPIFYNKNIVAICLGGGVFLEENNDLFDAKVVQGILRISEMKLNDIIKMLENTFNLLNDDEDVSLEKETNKDDIKQELFLLKIKLSFREIDVVKLINTGLTNKEISVKLNISEKTVKTHITHILEKLNLKNRLQIIIFCKNNLID